MDCRVRGYIVIAALVMGAMGAGWCPNSWSLAQAWGVLGHPRTWDVADLWRQGWVILGKMLPDLQGQCLWKNITRPPDSDRRLEVEAVFEGVLKPSHFGRNLAFKAAKENRALGRLREGNSTREPWCAGGFSNFRNNPWKELNNFPFWCRRTAHAGVLVVKAILSLGRRIRYPSHSLQVVASWKPPDGKWAATWLTAQASICSPLTQEIIGMETNGDQHRHGIDHEIRNIAKNCITGHWNRSFA